MGDTGGLVWMAMRCLSRGTHPAISRFYASTYGISRIGLKDSPRVPHYPPPPPGAETWPPHWPLVGLRPPGAGPGCALSLSPPFTIPFAGVHHVP